MNISIIGASQGVGLEAVKRGLERNHNITTLSRSKIDIPHHANLNMLLGDATNANDLSKAIKNTDAIVVALGTGSSIKKTTLYTDFAKALLELNKQQPITVPIIILTGFGAGDSNDYMGNVVIKNVFNALLGRVYADKTQMEKVLSQSNLNWQFVRAGLLKNGKLTQKYRAEPKLYPKMKIKGINRSDVADFMIKQAENPTLMRHYPSLSNT